MAESFFVVKAKPDSAPISHARWCEFVRQRPGFVPTQPVAGINPFTRKPHMFKAPDDSITATEGANEATAAWSQSGSSEIIVDGDEPIATRLAAEIAAALHGRFEPITT